MAETESRLFILLLLISSSAKTLPAEKENDAQRKHERRLLPCSLLKIDNQNNNASECSEGSVIFEGKCQQLLQQGSCHPSYWLVMNQTTGKPECKFQICSSNRGLFGGQCERLGSSDKCPATLQLQLDEFGHASCDCPPGRVYLHGMSGCFQPYMKGPCQQGVVQVEVNEDGRGIAECRMSPCSEAKVPLDDNCTIVRTTNISRFHCYSLMSKGPCNDGILMLDAQSMEAVCVGSQFNTIFNQPSSICRPGSLKDYQGRCRRRFRIALTRPVIPINRRIISRNRNIPVIFGRF